jgi:iron complex transport system substrate-binding protein
MENRRSFLKKMLVTSLVAHFPAILMAETNQTFLMKSFGELPPPQNIHRVLSAGPVSDVLLLSLVPEKLLGLSTHPLSDLQKPFFSQHLQQLSQTGRFAGRGTTASLEKVIQMKPDVIVDIGSITPTYVSTAERVQSQTNIPYILMNGSLAETPQQLSHLGELLGVKERGQSLADYAQKVLSQTHNIAQKITESSQLKIYSARGADGLETGLAGSIHTEVLDWIGAKNVASGAGEKIISRVSMEQLMLWQPDVIIAMDRHFYDKVQTDPLWQRLPAVKNKRIYYAPKLPFGWLDQPPSINRLLGVSWLAHVLYPELLSYDNYAQNIIEYYQLFYGYSLSHEALNQLTGTI